MSMKSLTIKLPLSIAQHMNDRGRLNPVWVSQFIHGKVMANPVAPKEPLGELTTGYTFKVSENLHRRVKLLSMEQDLAMNEYIGRLFNAHYWG